ncbi:hypothetical protein [Paenibacillus sp. RC67]|uniref:hypothetical protein n=1 Tax=Paenibacillus sp. RC67 TaxID=3039392 RepID=UPI0024AD204F|nr:hypothetical protein [Paenibacillus sp. RC67]
MEKINAIKTDVAALQNNQRQLESKLAELAVSAVSLKEVRSVLKSKRLAPWVYPEH